MKRHIERKGMSSPHKDKEKWKNKKRGHYTQMASLIGNSVQDNTSC